MKRRNIGIIVIIVFVTLLCYKHGGCYKMAKSFYEQYLLGNRAYAHLSDTIYNGIDISSHQGFINWKEVAKDEKLDFIYIKVTEGSTHIDKRGRRNIYTARRYGINVGAYHYLTTKSPPEEQFNNFKRHCTNETNLIPMLDVEEIDTLDRQSIIDLVSTMANLMEQHFHAKPIIYTTQWIYNNYLYPEFSDYTLFIGHPYKKKPQLRGYQGGYIWQYSQHNVAIAGINHEVDQNRFVNLTLEEIMLPTSYRECGNGSVNEKNKQ